MRDLGVVTEVRERKRRRARNQGLRNVRGAWPGRLNEECGQDIKRQKLIIHAHSAPHDPGTCHAGGAVGSKPSDAWGDREAPSAQHNYIEGDPEVFSTESLSANVCVAQSTPPNIHAPSATSYGTWPGHECRVRERQCSSPKKRGTRGQKRAIHL